MMQLNRLYDFDEDGNLLGIREVEYERAPYMEVLEDMANLGGETALLMDAESVGGSRAEIVFAPGEGISVPDDEYSQPFIMNPAARFKTSGRRKAACLR